MDYQKYSYVIAAPNRAEVVKAMDTEKTPKQLVKTLKRQDANVSRALRELVSKGVIECLTPNNKRGRIYILTTGGQEIRKRLLKDA